MVYGIWYMVYGIVWYGMVWYDIWWWYGMVWYGMVWYGMVWVLGSMVCMLYMVSYGPTLRRPVCTLAFHLKSAVRVIDYSWSSHANSVHLSVSCDSDACLDGTYYISSTASDLLQLYCNCSKALALISLFYTLSLCGYKIFFHNTFNVG